MLWGKKELEEKKGHDPRNNREKKGHDPRNLMTFFIQKFLSTKFKQQFNPIK